MPGTAVSIHVGVSSATCDCGEDRLTGPERDAAEMAKLARLANFKVLSTLTQDGSGATFRLSMGEAVRLLRGGGTLLLSFSGHGCQRFNVGGEPERDGYDETWCLTDAELRDDDIHAMWAAFGENVRILVIADSCHSGGLKLFGGRKSFTSQQLQAWEVQRQEAIVRQIRSGWAPPPELRPLLMPRDRERSTLKASVMLFAACKDRQKAQDGTPNSLFTSCLLDVWAGGVFSRSYVEFFKRVHARVSAANGRQHPGVALFGRPAPEWLQERPFQP